MITIQVAGAGAGKTFGLAKSILEKNETLSASHKKIYGITFTNSARCEIERAIIKQAGAMPENVEICTVHSFLLDEVIYPYNSYVFGEYYRKSTTSKLPDTQNYRSLKIRLLKGLNILHIEETYKAAKRIIDETMSTHNTNAKKARVRKVLTHIDSAVSCIFLDEAQDLDKHGLRIFDVLANNTSIYLYVVGDPKQAIKYPKAFDDFLSCYSANRNIESVHVMPSNNISRRLPKAVLKLSNLYCYPEQEQTTISNEQGSLLYIEASDVGYSDYLTANIDTGNIVCIDKKSGMYATSKHERKTLDAEIEDMLEGIYPNLDAELVAEAACLKFLADAESLGATTAAKTFLQDHGIDYSKRMWAMLMSTVQQATEESTHRVRSIQAIKGLESEACILILTPNTLNYLIRDNLEVDKQFNKEWKQMYVAITRATKFFVVAIELELFKSTDITIPSIKEAVEGLGFIKLPLD